MSSANIKVRISFDFDLQVPPALLALEHDALLKALHAALGSTVVQGMPTVSAKQLGKSGIALVRHHYHLDAAKLGMQAIPRGLLVAAAPHLTDAELDTLAKSMAGKTPNSEDETRRLLRRKALAMVSELRTVECAVIARLSSGATAELAATLNLANGGVIVAEKDRQQRLQSNQGLVPIRVDRAGATLNATFSGQTISGPVLGVEVAEIAAHRDALITAWQSR